jgi:hypothetical protein
MTASVHHYMLALYHWIAKTVHTYLIDKVIDRTLGWTWRAVTRPIEDFGNAMLYLIFTEVFRKIAVAGVTLALVGGVTFLALNQCKCDPHAS